MLSHNNRVKSIDVRNELNERKTGLYKAREQWVKEATYKTKRLTQSTRVMGGGSDANSRAMGEYEGSSN
jgi:hypothetical protein